MAPGLTGIVASEDGIVEKPALALLQELGWQGRVQLAQRGFQMCGEIGLLKADAASGVGRTRLLAMQIDMLPAQFL